MEQRRRPTVKFHSHVALSYVVAMRLKHSLEAPLIGVCSEAETHRLRCGRVTPRVFFFTRNCGIRVQLEFSWRSEKTLAGSGSSGRSGCVEK